MKLIVGLGNPGDQYTQTRHNVGFMAVDRLAERHAASFAKKTRLRSWVAACQMESQEVILAKPWTFMNLSGEAVFALLNFYSLETPELLVVVDDIYLPLGRLRLRARGSDGGHNGLKSIIQALDTEEFPRLRFGIEREEKRSADKARFVLDRFSSDEKTVLNNTLREFEDLVGCWLRDGIEKAMSLYNKKVKS